jgi:hypothetical protein
LNGMSGRNWRSFAPQEAFYFQTATSLLREEAFAWALPIFLHAAVTDPVEADVAVDFVAWSFLPDSPRKTPYRDPKRLTGPQRAVLYDWLEHYTDYEEEGWFGGDDDRSHITEIDRETRVRFHLYRETIERLRKEFPVMQSPT